MKLSLAIASLACLGYVLASPLMAPLSHNRTVSLPAVNTVQVARALPPSRQDMEKEVLSILKSAKAKGHARACEQISDRDFVHNLDRNLSFAKRGSETWTETLRRLVKYQTVHETVAEVFPDDIVDIIRSIDTSLMNDGALIGPEQRTQKALEPILDGICTSPNGRGIPKISPRIEEIVDVVHVGLSAAAKPVEYVCEGNPGQLRAILKATWVPENMDWTCLCLVQ
ncbi:hypothetical protein AB5N19_02279 [Seiridium cardinale]